MNKNRATQIAAINRYNSKTYDRLNVFVPKGEKAKIQAAASARRMSTNAFVKRAIEMLMASDV